MNIKILFGLPLAIALSTAIAPAASANVLTRGDGIYIRCDQCGVVRSIERDVVPGRDHGTVGAVLGALAGGVLGNQVGHGNGRKLATVGGAVGGGLAGHAIGTGGGGESYRLNVRMGNGTATSVQVTDASAIRAGDIVMIDAKGNVSPVR